ncbi:MAG: ribosomal RNA small subunit methyltransferase A [Candidatus Jacksonbacteria bacterium]|nr:ribosomal RNA small subunit methyltransferase A [Candidatus Jacksonbacteria bacterium]
MNYSDLYSTSKLSILLSKTALYPKKSLGQHFLIDKNIAEKIVLAANLSKKDTVLEIGAGLGALTYPLSLVSGRVVAYEIDSRLIPILEETVRDLRNVEVRNEDILLSLRGAERRSNLLSASEKDCFASLAMTKNKFSHCLSDSYKLIGNLPYYITSRILGHFLSAEHKPKRVVVTIQKEVAERICAKPPDMSLLAVSVQLYGVPKVIARVSKNCFFPSPKVDSAILAFDVLRPSDLNENDFFTLVKTGFSHKRKLLIRNLERGLSLSRERLEDAFDELGISSRARAEELGVEEWKMLTSKLQTTT